MVWVSMHVARIGLGVVLAGGVFMAGVLPAGAASGTTGCDVLGTLQDELSALEDVGTDSSKPTVEELEATYRGQAKA